MSNLPIAQPSKNARDVYEVTGAILESVPGGSVVKKFADIYLNRRIDAALKLLVEEIKNSGIQVLTDAQYEYYLPSAYRFAEQVRLGEYEHNLKILRNIIIDGLKNNRMDSGKVGRNARQLENLTEFELSVLVACSEIATMSKSVSLLFISSNSIVQNTSSFKSSNREDIKCALSVLYSRGLLFADGTTRYDKDEEYFFLTHAAVEIIEMAGTQV